MDFAFPSQKVAVEIQGGQYVRGAHLRPARYREDCVKLNDAQILGWILLWFTTDDITRYTRQTMDTLQRALDRREKYKEVVTPSALRKEL